MQWYSQLKVFLGLLSFSSVVVIVGICSSEATLSLTAQSSKEAVSSQDRLKASKLNAERSTSHPAILKPSTPKAATHHPAIGQFSTSSAAAQHPSLLKPSTPKAANRNSSQLKPSSSQGANLKPAHLKPANLKPQPLKPQTRRKPANLPIANLPPSTFHSSTVDPIALQARILQAAILDPTVLQAGIVRTAILDPTVLQTTVLHSGDIYPANQQASLVQSTNASVENVQVSRIDPAAVKPENLQAANLQVARIDLATVKPENLQASNLPASGLQSVFLKPATLQIAQLNRLAQNTPVTPENPQPNSNTNPVSPPPLPEPSDRQPAQPSTDTVPNPVPNSTGISVQRIQVTGSTVFGEGELNPLIKPVEGRTVTLEELRGVADAISQLYLDRGFITSRAVLVEDSLASGVAEIRVIEGSLEKIEVEGTRRVNQNYVRSRVQLGARTPLNTAKLEDQLRLLRIDPLFENVEASLRAGTGVGQSILVVRVTEANPFDGSVGIDNYSPPSVGSERLTANLGYRNVTGIGDSLSAAYNRTTAGGAETWDFGYRVPINAMNGTVQLRASFNQNQVIQEPFRILDIRGESELYEITYRQPFIRTPREEFALSLGFTFQDGQTFTFAGPTPFGFGPDEEGVSRTSVFKFGQEYTRRDVSGAWAFRSLFSFGTGLFDATDNSDFDRDFPDGQFVSWLAQVQRVQVLNPDNFLIIQADLQLALDGLLPAQQFVIGGGQSVRGYRQNVRAGDNGFRISVEDRLTLERNEAGIATFLLAPFLDVGYVWNVGGNPNALQDKTFIAGLGLGILWEPVPNLNLRLDYGLPLITLDDRGENAQDKGFYFSVNYNF
ncbi:MAG TPA: peptide ABC transporter permease [Cyanobacteria bacterium UBA8803]|nr:peptide ABC transporter permease [Cyanobacteria bacterium UBA9273]HBL62696.1 peptide ABC transporter permease [Cyanobacteria bacterium UBA8803]